MSDPQSMIELRVLDGPNLHLSGPAIQVRLDGTKLLQASGEQLQQWADAVGLADRDPNTPDGPGDPGSAARAVYAARWLRHVTRRLARSGGLRSLRVVCGPGHHEGELLVAFPWSREERAAKLGEWVGWCLDDIGTADMAQTFEQARERLRAVAAGPRPTVVTPMVPTVAITGTNGKTTTTRLTAALSRACGNITAWNATDGVFAADDDGVRQLKQGDWAGFGGAGMVMAVPHLDVAVIESARGGMLRRGMGVSAVDVGVVTNVSPDHMGEMGVQDLEDLARVKSIVVKIVKPDGWAVLNAEDPRVLAMADHCAGSVTVFAADPTAVQRALHDRIATRGVTVLDGQIALLEAGMQRRLLPVSQVPVCLGGLSRNNLANALAAVGAAWGLGLDMDGVTIGLRTFVSDGIVNAGRMNPYLADGRFVIVDVAHNQESLTALGEVGRGLLRPGARVHLVTGAIGDRPSSMIADLGRISGMIADHVVISHKPGFLRDNDPERVITELRRGLAQAGVPDPQVFDDEMQAFDHVRSVSRPGDVICFTVHDHLPTIGEDLRLREVEPATPQDIATWVQQASQPST